MRICLYVRSVCSPLIVCFSSLARSRSLLFLCLLAADMNTHTEVAFVVVRGDKPGDYDVKRLNSRPAPKRFGRKLTEAQKERATHICIDCGWVYSQAKTFDEQPTDYLCPQCAAPKKRFARYDAEKDEVRLL